MPTTKDVPRRSRAGTGTVRRLLGRAGIAFALTLSTSAFAISSADAPDVASRAVAAADKESDSVRTAIANAKASERSPEQRIADAEVLLKSRDFARAITALNEIVEKYPTHPTAYPDALQMLGEAYFQARQIYSARRVFREILEKGAESRMAPYVPRAYARLVDIALRLQNPKDLDELLARKASTRSRIGSYSARTDSYPTSALSNLPARSMRSARSRVASAMSELPGSATESTSRARSARSESPSRTYTHASS